MKKYTRNCDTCKNPYVGYGRFYCSSKCQPRTGHTEESKNKLRRPRGGSYHAIHAWLKSNYGKASLCENNTCEGMSERFEWALKKGKEHKHEKENYIQLCKKCHAKYDAKRGADHPRWKGGKAKCKECGKEMSIWPSQTKTGLCGICNRKLNPPWKGKKRGPMPWLNPNKHA